MGFCIFFAEWAFRELQTHSPLLAQSRSPQKRALPCARKFFQLVPTTLLAFIFAILKQLYPHGGKPPYPHHKRPEKRLLSKSRIFEENGLKSGIFRSEDMAICMAHDSGEITSDAQAVPATRVPTGGRFFTSLIPPWSRRYPSPEYPPASVKNRYVQVSRRPDTLKICKRQAVQNQSPGRINGSAANTASQTAMGASAMTM